MTVLFYFISTTVIFLAAHASQCVQISQTEGRTEGQQLARVSYSVIYSDFGRMGIWESWTLGAWDFGSMGLYEPGTLGVWDFGIMGLCEHRTL